MLWIPNQARAIQVMLLVGARVQEAGHRGVDTKLARLSAHCVWTTLEHDAREFVLKCLCCADYKSGAVVPRPLTWTAPGRRFAEVVHFVFLLCWREPCGCGIDTADGY